MSDLTVVIVRYPVEDFDLIVLHDVSEVRIRQSKTIDIYFDCNAPKEGGEFHLPPGTVVKVTLHT